MSIFIRNNYLYKVEREPAESVENFIDRGYFIVAQKPNTIKEYEDTVKMSKIMINVIVKGAQYDTDIMTKLSTMLNKLDD